MDLQLEDQTGFGCTAVRLARLLVWGRLLPLSPFTMVQLVLRWGYSGTACAAWGLTVPQSPRVNANSPRQDAGAAWRKQSLLCVSREHSKCPRGWYCSPLQTWGAVGALVSSGTDLAPSPRPRVFLLLFPPLSGLVCLPPRPGAHLLVPKLPSPCACDRRPSSDLRSPNSWQALFSSAPSLPCFLPASHPTQTHPLPSSYRIPALQP